MWFKKSLLLFLFSIISLISAVIASGGEVTITGEEIIINVEKVSKEENIKDLQSKKILIQSDQEFWLTFMTILSTLFAVFFVYSGFKIESTVTSINETETRIKKIEKDALEEMEFSNQLKYSIHYMMSKQYIKAIDALTVLRSEATTIKDNYKLNSCYYFLAICNYEQGLLDNDIEFIAKAVEYINEAIEDPSHPLKNEILEKFNSMDHE